MNSYYNEEELKNIGFKAFGNNVLISKKSSIYSPELIEIGSNVRVDDFCILSGKIALGNYIHIAPYSSLCGGEEGVFIEDFVNISRKVEVFAISDDYSGETLTSPLLPDKYKKIKHGKVQIKKQVLIGPASILLPGITVEEGTAVGAMSLIKESTQPWGIYAGIPAKIIKQRKKDLLKLEEEFLNEQNI